MQEKKGSLTIVGTGLVTPQHISREVQDLISRADEVLCVLPDPLGLDYLLELNPSTRSLGDYYQLEDNRRATYTAMTQEILARVRAGAAVVAVFYGHPGVFVSPSHWALQQARAEGYRARMLPAISAEDCLFADLEIDPASDGCISIEVTYFMLYHRVLDTAAHVLLWQLGVVGDLSFKDKAASNAGVKMLRDKLRLFYPESQKMAVYEAANIPLFQPQINWVTLASLSLQDITSAATLYIPPASKRNYDQDFCTRHGLWPSIDAHRRGEKSAQV